MLIIVHFIKAPMQETLESDKDMEEEKALSTGRNFQFAQGRVFIWLSNYLTHYGHSMDNLSQITM